MTKDRLLDGEGIYRRFKGKLIKIIKDVNDMFDGYASSPIIIQVLLH